MLGPWSSATARSLVFPRPTAASTRKSKQQVVGREGTGGKASQRLLLSLPPFMSWSDRGAALRLAGSPGCFYG